MRNRKSTILLLSIIIVGFAFASSGFAKDDVEFTPGEDSGFYYTIQKGDTLWDLSQKFYNSQWDWPGLWEMNNDIKNPHWIYPGKKIRIFLKDKAKLKPIIVPVKKVAAPKPTPVQPSFSFAKINATGFLKKEKQTSLGKILKEEEGHLLMNKNDIIYITPSGNGTMIPGKKYHIFSADPVKQPIGEKEDKLFVEGFKHIVKAEIQIIAHKVSYVTARITRGYRPVRVGDLIMTFYDRKSVFPVDDNPAPIDARIIFSQDDHLMINDYIIAFIDAGKSRVKPGQIYTVLRKNTMEKTKAWPREKNPDIKLHNLESGKMIVLHTEDIASTVMILSSSYAIHPNDIVN